MSDDEREEQAGDPACWLDRVCQDCGAFVEAPRDGGTAICWRCGRRQDAEE